MIHECSRAEEIGAIKKSVTNLENIINENGSGLRDTVTALNISVKELSKNSEAMTTAIHGILKFQNQTIGEIRESERNKSNARWAIGLAVVSLISIIAILLKTNA